MKTSEHTGYNLVESSFYQDAFLIQPRAKAYLQIHRVKLQSHKQNTRQKKREAGGQGKTDYKHSTRCLWQKNSLKWQVEKWQFEM